MQFEYKTKGTCSQRIFFEIEDGKVCIGNTIEIQEVGEDEIETYAVVSADEIEMYALLNTDMEDVLLSANSPVGKALIGHSAGETVSVETPACTIDFVIKNIYKYEEQKNPEQASGFFYLENIKASQAMLLSLICIG